MQEKNYWMRNSRFSRRRFAQGAGLAGVGAAGFALVGCGDDDDDGGTTPASGSPTAAGTTQPGASPTASGPKKGGDVVLSVGAPTSQSLDPHITSNLGMFYWGIISNLLVETDHKKIEPLQGALVEKWEQVDPSTLNLTIRQGVKWHQGHNTNGRAFTAEDAAYNIMRIAGKLPEDEKRKASFQRQTLLTGMDKATAVDEKTVKVTFTEPNSQYLQGLADWRQWAVAKESVEKDPDFKDAKQWSGTGGFMVDSWDGTTLTGKYVANPDYWRKGQPYLNSVSQVSFSDTAATLAAFISGKISFITAMSDTTRDDIKKGRSEAKIASWPHTGWEYARMNQTKDPFKDHRARQAWFLSLNYTELLEANYGKGDWFDYTGPLVSGFPGVWSSEEVAKMSGWDASKKDADLKKAAELFSAAGVDPKKASFKLHPGGTAGAWFDNAVRIKDQLEQLYPGIKVEVQTIADGAELVRNLNSGNYDVMCYGSFPSPSAVLEAATNYRTGGGRNYTKYSNSDVDRMIDSLVKDFDTQSRQKTLGELQQKLLDDIFIMPIGKRKTVWAHQPDVHGIEEWSGVGTFESYNAAFASDSLWIA